MFSLRHICSCALTRFASSNISIVPHKYHYNVFEWVACLDSYTQVSSSLVNTNALEISLIVDMEMPTFGRYSPICLTISPSPHWFVELSFLCSFPISHWHVCYEKVFPQFFVESSFLISVGRWWLKNYCLCRLNLRYFVCMVDCPRLSKPLTI